MQTLEHLSAIDYALFGIILPPVVLVTIITTEKILEIAIFRHLSAIDYATAMPMDNYCLVAIRIYRLLTKPLILVGFQPPWAVDSLPLIQK